MPMSESRVIGRGGTPVVLLRGAVERGGVALISEVWGVDASLREWATKLVEEGFTVALPDLWWRQTGPPELSGPEAIRAAVASLDDGEALRDVAAAVALLEADRPRIVMGFCMGGLYARLASAVVPGLAAAVEFYGRIVYATLSAEKPAQPLDMLPGRACPLLCHFGTDDPVAPPNHVDELERRLAGQAAPGRVHRYPGVGHAFMNAASPAYSAPAAALAWSRTLRFLDEVLPD